MTSEEIERLIKPRFDWKLGVVGFLALVIVGLLGYITPAATGARSGTEAIRHSTDITSCRAQRSAAVTDATTDWNAARSDNETLQNEWDEAISAGDVATIAAIRPKFAPARRAINATKDRMIAANDAYQRATRLAVSDPDRFLRECMASTEVSTSTTTSSTPVLFGAVGSTTSTTKATTAKPRPVKRTTTTTRPTTTTGSTTTTAAPTTTATPCGLPPLTIPRGIPCPL